MTWNCVRHIFLTLVSEVLVQLFHSFHSWQRHTEVTPAEPNKALYKSLLVS